MNKEQRERLREKVSPYIVWTAKVPVRVTDLRALLDALDAAEEREPQPDLVEAREFRARKAETNGEPTFAALYRSGNYDTAITDDEALSLIATIRALLDALDAAESRATAAEARVALLEGLVAHLKESLADQAAARHDPTMPLLTEEVLEALEGDAEAQYALADTREDRVNSHGLSLLCEWQRRALAAKLEGRGDG